MLVQQNSPQQVGADTNREAAPSATMDDERFTKWIQASQGLNHIEEFMIVVLQGLGRLDCQLISQDERFGQLPEKERGTVQESILLSDRTTLSYLWVLGAYELVRALDERCHSDTSLLSDSLMQQIRSTKHQIERLRIPLAKMEPAKRHATDSPIAYPALSLERGIAWQLGSDIYISRRDLSDSLLQLVSDIREFVSSAA
jgi:hypothetical protein